MKLELDNVKTKWKSASRGVGFTDIRINKFKMTG
jgi:hypothetical protein